MKHVLFSHVELGLFPEAGPKYGQAYNDIFDTLRPSLTVISPCQPDTC